MAAHGLRYVVIAAGAPDDPAGDEDIEFIGRVVQDLVPFKVTVLSDDVSSAVTHALLRERSTTPPL